MSSKAAIYHCETRFVSKNDEAASARDYFQYCAREGRFADKHDGPLVHLESGNMPAWASSAEEFWIASDKFERANGCVMREIEFALPLCLNEQQRIDVAREFAKTICKNELAFTLAIHGNDGNPGAHLIFSDRQQDAFDRPPEQFFKRYNPKSAADGGSKKYSKADRGHDWVLHVRSTWSEVCNRHLASAGHDIKIDHRSHADRGIDLVPGKHIGRAGTHQKQGKPNRAQHHNRQAKAINTELLTIQQALSTNRVAPARRQKIKTAILKKNYPNKISDALAGQLLFTHRLPDQSISISLRDQTNNNMAGRIFDEGDSLRTRNSSDHEISALIALAKAKGWDRLELSGDIQFRRKATAAARAAGIHVVSSSFLPSRKESLYDRRFTPLTSRPADPPGLRASKQIGPERMPALRESSARVGPEPTRHAVLPGLVQGHRTADHSLHQLHTGNLRIKESTMENTSVLDELELELIADSPAPETNLLSSATPAAAAIADNEDEEGRSTAGAANGIQVDATEQRKQQYKRQLLEEAETGQYRKGISQLLTDRLLYVERESDRIKITLKDPADSENKPTGVVIDTGDKLEVDTGSAAEIQAAIELALSKGWPSISVDGTEEFKQKVVEAAHAAGLRVVGHPDPENLNTQTAASAPEPVSLPQTPTSGTISAAAPENLPGWAMALATERARLHEQAAEAQARLDKLGLGPVQDIDALENKLVEQHADPRYRAALKQVEDAKNALVNANVFTRQRRDQQHEEACQAFAAERERVLYSLPVQKALIDAKNRQEAREHWTQLGAQASKKIALCSWHLKKNDQSPEKAREVVETLRNASKDNQWLKTVLAPVFTSDQEQRDSAASASRAERELAHRQQLEREAGFQHQADELSRRLERPGLSGDEREKLEEQQRYWQLRADGSDHEAAEKKAQGARIR